LITLFYICNKNFGEGKKETSSCDVSSSKENQIKTSQVEEKLWYHGVCIGEVGFFSHILLMKIVGRNFRCSDNSFLQTNDLWSEN